MPRRGHALPSQVEGNGVGTAGDNEGGAGQLPRYHSQVSQDFLFDTAVFQGMTGGVFVDIGAHDGETFSNSLMFERDRGWSGLCIEPNPDVFPKLAARRTATCLNVAVSNQSGVLNFTRISGAAEMLSGIRDDSSPDHTKRIEREVKASGGTIATVPVQAQTPAEIFAAHGINEVHYLSLDAEGSEAKILAALPESTMIHAIDVECEPVDFPPIERAIGPHYRFAGRFRHDVFFIHRDSEFVGRIPALRRAIVLARIKRRWRKIFGLKPRD